MRLLDQVALDLEKLIAADLPACIPLSGDL
jgi:hypothetical protein